MDVLYMRLLVLMTLTLIQGHSGLARANYQLCMLSATRQAISMELATTVSHYVCDLDLDFANVVNNNNNNNNKK